MAKNGNAVPFQRNPATPPPAEKCGGHRRAATAVLLVVAAKTSIMEIVRDKREWCRFEPKARVPSERAYFCRAASETVNRPEESRLAIRIKPRA
jgi:hypothetical protein